MSKGIITVLAVLAMFAGTPAIAKAADGSAAMLEAATSLAPGRYLWEADAIAGPVSIIVSIADQRLYVYRGDTIVAASAVSTGREGNDTPVGKKEMHRSNLYNDAPMPFMQRLTWDGVAIHAGRNPGHPDSHGCIRVPAAFAKKLFAATEMGATVEVTDLPVIEGTPAPVSDYQETAAANRAAETQLAGFLAGKD